MLATPVTPVDVALGEIGWALMRGAFYSVAFLVVMLVMGLSSSWWAVLALPAAVLIGFAFAAIGMACTTYMQSWQDFEYITLVHAADVPVLGDVLPAVGLPRLAAVGGAAARRSTTRPRWCESSRPAPSGSGRSCTSRCSSALGLVGLLVTGRRLEKLLLT